MIAGFDGSMEPFFHFVRVETDFLLFVRKLNAILTLSYMNICKYNFRRFKLLDATLLNHVITYPLNLLTVVCKVYLTITSCSCLVGVHGRGLLGDRFRVQIGSCDCHVLIPVNSNLFFIYVFVTLRELRNRGNN